MTLAEKYQNITLAEKYQKEYEIGFTIFMKLFQLKKDNLIKVMKYIFKDNKSVLRILDNIPRVIKIIDNDIPNEITINCYDGITINYFGVTYKPEHGAINLILKFDEFFNLDAALVDNSIVK